MSAESESGLPYGLPPILPSINEKLEQYLENPELLPMHNDEPIRFWNRTPQPKRLLFAEMAPLSTTLTVDRDASTGKYFLNIRKEHRDLRMCLSFFRIHTTQLI